MTNNAVSDEQEEQGIKSKISIDEKKAQLQGSNRSRSKVQSNMIQLWILTRDVKERCNESANLLSSKVRFFLHPQIVCCSRLLLDTTSQSSCLMAMAMRL
jgi:hypothetical protein